MGPSSRPPGRQQFQQHFPKLRAAHLFPGFVYTCVCSVLTPEAEVSQVTACRGCARSRTFLTPDSRTPDRSNALASASIVPTPVIWAYNLAGPLMARFTPMGNLPAWYAEIPVYVGANPEARGKGLEASNERLKPLGWPKWAEGTTGKKVWEKLVAMIEQ